MAGFGSKNNIIDRENAVENVKDFALDSISGAFNIVAAVGNEVLDIGADVVKEVSTNASNRWNNEIEPFLDEAAEYLFGGEETESKSENDANPVSRGEYQIPQGSDTMGLLQEMLVASGHNIGTIDKVNGPLTNFAVNGAIDASDNPIAEGVSAEDPLTLNHLLAVSRAAYIADGETYNTDFRERVMDVIKNSDEHLINPSPTATAIAANNPTLD